MSCSKLWNNASYQINTFGTDGCASFHLQNF
jgi:hypothetical protein